MQTNLFCYFKSSNLNTNPKKDDSSMDTVKCMSLIRLEFKIKNDKNCLLT
jgi:hypothetical protein